MRPPATLAQIVRREVALYAGSAETATLYAVLDDARQTYAVLVVEPDRSLAVPVWVFLLARVQGEHVIIEEDTSLNKHLVQALLVNGGIPRSQIILAYRGEPVPAAAASSA
ncbi:MAG: hypothetical protein MUE40_21565 [Anaerolineae bacterium]|nr:hypothetical protein [Anaerolineae bacterium]